MDPATLILVGILLLGIVLLAVQRDRMAARLRDAQDQLRNKDASTIAQRRRKPEEMPPGAIPVELALAVHEEWKRAGYHLVGDTRVVLRLLSIAHRVMCQPQAHSFAPATYNDGDRCPPARLACRSFQTGDCTFPACECEAVETPPPPLPPRPAPNKPGKI